MENLKQEIDLDNDGIVNSKEIEIYEQRATNRRKMAWVSLVAMIVSAILIMFFVPDSRLDKIKEMLDLYWIALGGVVGAYVGISAWTKRG
jgi:cytochrome bd-type quinol oxidase subunit 2